MAAGVLVTTIDETKRLPTRIITFPMTAVSRGLQAGMRLQQNIAEMAIKGDEFFAPYCEKAEEQPEWARFDEDDDPVISIPPAVSATEPAVVAPTSVDTAANGAPAKAAPAKKAPARKAAARKPATAPAAPAEAPAATGRFALYSTPPAEVVAESEAAAPAVATGDQPDVVVLLDYDTLTLAQLRAKLRGLSADELGELADYERDNRNRAPFATMIDNRIASHQKKSGA